MYIMERGWQISIHSLVKRETSESLVSNFLMYDFNPLPRKEGDTGRAKILNKYVNFNPLPRKEGDSAVFPVLPALFPISIHSLVKRETDRRSAISLAVCISIHSLVKRETESNRIFIVIHVISIHSLVKRETSEIQTLQQSLPFQSTPS